MRKLNEGCLTRSSMGFGLLLLAASCSAPAEGEGGSVPPFSSPTTMAGMPGAPNAPGAANASGATTNGMTSPGGSPGNEGTPNVGMVNAPVGAGQMGGAQVTAPGQTPPSTTPPASVDGVVPPATQNDGTPLPPPRDLSCAGINVAAGDVISDFNTDGPVMYSVGNRGGTTWESYSATPASDPISPGNDFQIDPAQSGPCNSGGSLHVSSSGNTGFGVGVGINFRRDITPGVSDLYDARADGYTGVAFYALCSEEVESTFLKLSDDATEAEVQTPQCSYDGAPPLTTLCRQYGVKNSVLVSNEWTRYELYFDEALLDTDATIAGTGLHANALTGLQIQFNSRAGQQPNGFDCFIDDVHFLRAPTPRAPAPVNVTSVNGHTIARGGYYTEGNRIFDASGNVKIFKGIARPSFEYDPAGLGITREDIQRMRAKGANVVRYSLSEGYWLSNHPQFNRNYQAYVDRAVQWTLQAGMDVIIDLHWSGSPTADQQQMASRQSITFWQQVAQKYAGDGRVLFELYNEPHDVSPQVWRNGDGQFAGMQQMYDAVRAAGANNLVLVGGLDFAYNLEMVLPGQQLTGINIAYVTHPYRFKNPPPPQGYDGVVASVPIVATEFGDADVGGIGPNDCGTAPYTSAINDFTRLGVSWTAWAWVVEPARCSFPSLLDRYDGTPTPPGQVVFDAMRN
jgi:endoglucanase